jgi:hypothetical protein
MTLEFRRRFGVPAMFIGLTVAVVATVMLIRSYFTYGGMARRDFGGRARVAAIVELYEHVEKSPPTDFVAIEDDPEMFGFPRTRIIPASAIPKEVDDKWRKKPYDRGSVVLADFGDVLAHYDGQHQLRAIEFFGSRYGGFVSRDPALKPKMWGELQQLAGAPIFITARVSGGD